jgi:predicted secreted protein
MKSNARESMARLHTLEEARQAREMRESQAFNDAMRRFEELQRRTVWQRIKALFRGGRC